jgi:site-specific DNA-cytosine methylase
MWPTPRAKEPGRTTKGYGRGLAELIEGKEQLEPKNMWRTPDTSIQQQGNVFQRENENEIRKGNADQSQRSAVAGGGDNDVANTSSEQSHSNDNGQEQREISQQEQIELGGRSGGTLWPSNWEFEPNVGRVANGVPGRVHRLKGLGNSIVPKIAEEIGKAIIGAYNGSR